MSCLKNLPTIVWKLLPTIILLVLGAVAGATDVFSTQVREALTTTLKQRGTELMPVVVNLLIVAILFNIAYLLYHPLVCGLVRVLEETHASDRGKNFAIKAVKLLYWLICTFVILSLFASELMGKMVLGFSVLGAAITLSLQDAAKNFICGLLMQFTQRVKPGDSLKTIGADVEGKIVDIGYLSTVIDTENGRLSIPNIQIWDKPLLQKKPKPSPIILPPGCERPEPDTKESK